VTTRLLAIAIAVEGRKAAASRVLTSITTLLVIGVAAITAAATAAVDSGNQQFAAKLGAVAAEGSWPTVLEIATQVTAAAGFLAFGVGLSWLFGREFAEGTITGLFGLPVNRPTLALAKLIVYLLWTTATAAVLIAVVAVTAAAVTWQVPGAPELAGLARLLALAMMTAALPLPAAWAATIGRGMLPAIATTVGLMAVTQILVVVGPGAGWFPPAAPALWALLPGTIASAQLLLAAVFAIGFGLLTLHTWQRLQLDR
jgi:ABC-2 type transport system permease protein